MATIHDDQSHADVSIEELSGDYIQVFAIYLDTSNFPIKFVKVTRNIADLTDFPSKPKSKSILPDLITQNGFTQTWVRSKF